MINLLRHRTKNACEHQPFSQIAPYYDLLMKDVDYEQWARYIAALVERAGLPAGTELLDIGCGTGTMALLLARQGFAVTGIDSSPEMLKIARDKASKIKSAARFHEGDLRSFAVKKPCNVVTSLFDSVNYLLRNDELEECFRRAHKALQPDGIFLFDINSVYALSEYWNGRLETRDDRGVISIWKHRYDVGDSCAELQLTLFVPARRSPFRHAGVPQGKLYKKIMEMHHERAFELMEIEALLGKAGFKKFEMFKHGSYEPPLANTTRVMVVAYK